MLLGQRLHWLFLQIVQQITSGHELRHNVVVLRILIRIHHLDDVTYLTLGALTQNVDFIAFNLV